MEFGNRLTRMDSKDDSSFIEVVTSNRNINDSVSGKFKVNQEREKERWGNWVFNPTQMENWIFF